MPQPSNHKAAVRAVSYLGPVMLKTKLAIDITEAYRPLVEAAQDAAVCRFGRTDVGCGCSGCELRRALEETV